METKALGLKDELKSLVRPIFVEIALVMLLGAVDTVMLSKMDSPIEGGSDNAVAAVGLDNQLINLVILIFQFVSMGTAIVCAQYIGAGLRKKLVQVVGIAIMMNTIVGITMSSILFFYAENILNIMGLRPELMGDGLIYLKITGSMTFFQAISLAFSASLRSAGMAKYPMRVTVIVNILNILGNYSLIFGHFGLPALGVKGAAISTVICRGFSMISLAIIHTKKHIHKYPFEWFKPFPWQELKNILKIGVPAAGEQLSYCLSQVAITYFINKLGNTALSTRTYCANCIMFVNLFCISIVQGGGIVVGHLIGKKHSNAAYLMGNFVHRYALIVTLIVSTCLALAGNSILKFFTNNQEIIHLGTIIFFIDIILGIGRVGNIFATGTLRSTGDAVYPVLIGIIFQWSIAVGVSYLLGITFGFGLIGMWIGFTLDENVRGIILRRRWHSKKWEGKGFVK
ncbi:MAG: MATE family efflux transporter [Bacteroidales bacterium]|nr:MATE family efflux transporter [Bacteroidales bacterium]